MVQAGLEWGQCDRLGSIDKVSRMLGNHSSAGDDYSIVEPFNRCEIVREALSAFADGESAPLDSSDVDAHLDGCAACREWGRSALEVTRWLRVREAVTTPDLTDRILSRHRARVRYSMATRVGLGLAAVVLVVTGWSQLFADHSPHQHSPLGDISWAEHVFDESAAWNLALGIGLGWAAIRPRSAAGLTPTLTAFTIVLIVVSARDLAGGSVPVARVVSHLPVVVGLGLLHIVVRITPASWDGDPNRMLESQKIWDRLRGGVRDAA